MLGNWKWTQFMTSVMCLHNLLPHSCLRTIEICTCIQWVHPKELNARIINIGISKMLSWNMWHGKQKKKYGKRKPKRINPPTLFMIPFISFCCILILLMLLLLVIVIFEGNCFEIIISKQFFCLYVVCIESEDY